MSYTLSVVLLIPAAHRDAINELAESLGYGPGNLSVPLVHSDGSEWYGGHTWAALEFLDQLSDPAYQGAAMSALVVSAIPEGTAYSNWNNTLAANGLSVVETEE